MPVSCEADTYLIQVYIACRNRYRDLVVRGHTDTKRASHMSYLEEKELESTYMITAYARKPVEFVRGTGVHLYDGDGKEYLDFLSGIGVVCLGHAYPAVSQAIADQAQKLMQVGNYFYIEGRGEFARDLSSLLNDGDAAADPWKLFFANSGAEANEGAIKLARKYGKLHLNGAGTVLTALRSFHGRTLSTTAATGQEAKQESFAPMPHGFAHFDTQSIDSLATMIQACLKLAEEQGKPEIAPVAVMLECVQGEGGVWPFESSYLQDVEALAREHGLLLIIDEVQTGFYRTGRAFSFMHAGIKPDVVTMAKGIANGFPCAAFAAAGKAADVLVPGEHGSTFGGNPLAIAAGRATIAELERLDIQSVVKETGNYFMAKLAELPHVNEVRGRGLMLGASLDTPVALQIADAALEQGMVFNSIGDSTLRFLPPLLVSRDDIDALCSVLAELLVQQTAALYQER